MKIMPWLRAASLSPSVDGRKNVAHGLSHGIGPSNHPKAAERRKNIVHAPHVIRGVFLSPRRGSMVISCVRFPTAHAVGYDLSSAVRRTVRHPHLHRF